MGKTINDIRAEVSILTNEMRRLNGIISMNISVSKIREMNGVETVLTEPKNYHELMASYHEHVQEIARLNGEIQRFNNTTTLSNGMTIAHAINYLSGLRSERKLYESARNFKNIMRRKTDGGMNGVAYYEVIESNFDAEVVEKKYTELTSEIEKLESEINTANMTEIDV